MRSAPDVLPLHLAGYAALVTSMVSPLWDICAAYAALVPSIVSLLYEIRAGCAALVPCMVSPLCGMIAPHMLPLSFLWYHHCGISAPHMLPLSLPWYHRSVGYLHCICCPCPFHGIPHLSDICAACAAPVPSMVSPLCGISAPHMLPLFPPWHHPSVGYLRRMCYPCPFHRITTLWDICAACAGIVPSIVSPLCGLFAPHMLPLSFPWYHPLWNIRAAYAALVPSMVSPLCGISALHMLPLSLPWYHHSVGYLRRICCPCHFHGITTVGYLCRICCLCPFHDITHLSDICAACAALVPSMISPLCWIFAPDVLPLSLPSYHYSVGYLRRMCCPCQDRHFLISPQKHVCVRRTSAKRF